MYYRYFFLLFFLLPGCYISAQESNTFASVPPSSPSEKFLLDKAKTGSAADLASHENKGDNQIRAEFLRSLLLQLAEAKEPPKSVRIAAAKVNGQFSMKRAHLPFTLSLSGCVFEDFAAIQDVTFDQSVEIEDSEFLNGMVVENVTIKGNLLFDGNRNKIANKDAEQALSITKTQVDGRIEMLDPDSTLKAELQQIKAREILIRMAKDLPSLKLSGVEADSVLLRSDFGKHPLIGDFDISSARIKHDLYLRDVYFDKFNGTGMSVTGQFMLSRVRVNKELNLSFATINHLKWSVQSALPCDPRDTQSGLPCFIELNGTSFQELAVARQANVEPATSEDPMPWPYPPSPDDSLDSSVEFLRRAAFSASAFDTFEQSLNKSGLGREAEDVYLLGRHKRRRQDISANPLTWVWWASDFAQEYLLGYGRRAFWPLLWSVAVIVVGRILFNNKNNTDMVATAEKPIGYSPLWYSIELFLPVVTLGVAKDWRPSGGTLATYARFHQLAGWVLIPVALAAVTGFSK